MSKKTVDTLAHRDCGCLYNARTGITVEYCQWCLEEKERWILEEEGEDDA